MGSGSDYTSGTSAFHTAVNTQINNHLKALALEENRKLYQDGAGTVGVGGIKHDASSLGLVGKPGPILEYETPVEGIKHDQGKTQYALVPYDVVGSLECGEKLSVPELIEGLQLWSACDYMHEIKTLVSQIWGFTLYATGHVLPYSDTPLETYSPVIKGVAEVMSFGAKKYAAHNWRKGMNWTRLSDATIRHLTSYKSGEILDPESGLNHLYHACTDMLFLLTYTQEQLGTDDRYKGE